MSSANKPQNFGRATDDEALRLTVAFYCVMDPDHRAEIVELAEKRARESVRVDGLTHFVDLDLDKKAIDRN